MNPNQIKAIEYTVETIEKNLEKPFHLDELSKEVGISKYHLLRLFNSITDKSLMAYVRSRILSLSLSDLINTDLNIIDIAVKYHFDYEQSYIRAFQNQFHITPAKYRRLKYEMPIEQKIDIRTLSNIGQGFVIRPKMVMKPQFYVQGIQEEIFHEQNLTEFTTNKLAILFHEKYLPIVPNKINKHIYLAIVFDGTNIEISSDYLPCVETSILNSDDAPLKAYTIPQHEYAVFRYVGLHKPEEVTYKTLQELYIYIFEYFQANKALKQAKPFHFEKMDLTVCSDMYCEMDIYYPICT
jgi:AraC family transcriptional regulator